MKRAAARAAALALLFTAACTAKVRRIDGGIVDPIDAAQTDAVQADATAPAAAQADASIAPDAAPLRVLAKQRAGTRLVPRQLVSLGARKQLNYFPPARLRAGPDDHGEGVWHDRQLNTNCSFTHDATGVMRCLPLATELGTFRDASCTELVTTSTSISACLSWASASYGRYLSAPPVCTTDGEFRTPEVYEIGERLSATTLYDRNPAGRCRQIPGTRFAWALHKVSPEIFARAYEHRDSAHSFEVLSWSTDDGALQPSRIIDRDRGEPCWPDMNATEISDRQRCLPASASVGIGFFSDVACAVPVSYPYECFQPKVIIQTDRAAPRYRVHAAGPPAAMTYRGDEQYCEASPPVPGAISYGLGDPIPIESFPELVLKPIENGALAGLAWADPEEDFVLTPASLFLTDFGFYDRKSDSSCYPERFGDGSLRCLSGGGLGSINDPRVSRIAYLDSACTEEVWLMRSVETEPPQRLIRSRDACPFTVTIYELGEELLGATLYQGTPAACTALATTRRAFRIGAVVSPEAFPLVEIE